MKNIDIERENEKRKIEKDIELRSFIKQLNSNKSKYSTFGGEENTCSIEIPNYLKFNKI